MSKNSLKMQDENGQMEAVLDANLLEEVRRFLFLEAHLLDTFQFHTWLELFTDDVRYTMPTRESTPESFSPPAGELHFGLMDETKRTLQMRVRQLDTGLRHVEVPPSVTERFVTNVFVERQDHSADHLVAHSKIIVIQIRHGTHQSIFTGRRRDQLRRVGDELKIAAREVRLTQTVLERSISIFF